MRTEETTPQRDGQVDGDLAALVLDALPDATAVLGPDGTILAQNRAWHTFAQENGGTIETVGVGVNYLEVCEHAARSGCQEAGEALAGIRSVLTGRSARYETEYPCPSPRFERWFLLRVAALPEGAVVSHVDITRRKRAEEDLERRASCDPLTGLANRRHLLDRLAEELTRSSEEGTGVVYLDLDGFKPVNDTFGHGAGDEVLREVAARIQDAIRRNDVAGRLGGDEFVVLAPQTTPSGLEALQQRLHEALQESHQVHGVEVKVRASIGTHHARSGEDPSEVLSRADDAMYQVKGYQAKGRTRGDQVRRAEADQTRPALPAQVRRGA